MEAAQTKAGPASSGGGPCDDARIRQLVAELYTPLDRPPLPAGTLRAANERLREGQELERARKAARQAFKVRPSLSKRKAAAMIFSTGAMSLTAFTTPFAGIEANDMKDKVLYKPRGCDYCTGTGFRGRVGIFEMMIMNNEIRTLAFERAATNKVRKAALASGMKSLLQDGKLKVLNGITTAEEIVKVAQVEGVITSG